MMLQALARYYQRLLRQRTEGVAPYGYSPEKVSYGVVLTPDGRVSRVDDLRDTTGKKAQPRLLDVPQPEKRTVGIKPSFLWDKTSYVLGVSAQSKRADKEHEAFKAFHLPLLTGETDPGLQALAGFLQTWTPDQFAAPPFNPDMLDSNMVFRLEGEKKFIHERPAAVALRARLLGGGQGVTGEQEGAEVVGAEGAAPEGVCLVTGEVAPLARLHLAIKGVSGAQSSGASLVSFNLEAFKSYGKDQGDNAPVSQQAAFAYTTVLNVLLRRSEGNRQRLQVGDTTLVFWAEVPEGDEGDAQAQAAEDVFATLVAARPDDDSEALRLRAVLEGVAKGQALAELVPGLAPNTRMYVLGLSPNAARLSVRYWQVDTLEVFARRLAQHSADIRVEPLPWTREPTLYRLLLATVPHREGSMPKNDDAFNNLVGETLRAVLSGGYYPLSLLANTLMRMRADGHITGLRVALCKGVLVRQRRKYDQPSDEEIPVSLDKQSTQPGYLLGRLFAVLEYAQRGALGDINATIRDRYFGAASATPAAVFPMLLRNTQNHLSKLRKEKPGLAVVLEKEIGEIVGGLSDSFPRSFRLEDQGRFAIGYYHQSRVHFTKKEGAAVEGEALSPEPTTEGAL